MMLCRVGPADCLSQETHETGETNCAPGEHSHRSEVAENSFAGLGLRVYRV